MLPSYFKWIVTHHFRKGWRDTCPGFGEWQGKGWEQGAWKRGADEFGKLLLPGLKAHMLLSVCMLSIFAPGRLLLSAGAQ